MSLPDVHPKTPPVAVKQRANSGSESLLSHLLPISFLEVHEVKYS